MKQYHHFHPSILREYDIRGIYEKTLSEADAKAVGQCFGYIIKQNKGTTVALGKDGRLSSDSLEDALIKGLQEAGVDVIRLGLCPTPLLYYAVKELPTDGGIMITGSHNGGTFNGFKMTLKDRPFYGKDIQTFQDIIKEFSVSKTLGTIFDQDIKSSYENRLLQDYHGKSLKVVWDMGNGSAGPIIKPLIDKLKGDHILLFEDVDGHFPNHHPDPTQKENLEILKDRVLHEKADLGIAFDGDGDRIGVIDNRGNFWLGDYLMILFSREVLSQRPHSKIIMDIKASDVLVEDIKNHGGVPLMVPTGHSLIKAQMAITHAPLAGETSGHIFFADHYYGFDDALYAAIRLLNIVSNLPHSLAHVYESLPDVHNTPELRIPCDNVRKQEVVNDIKERLLQDPLSDVLTIDGVRVKTKDGWWLLRASNTEEVLVCRCESSTVQGLENLKETVKHQLRLSHLSVPEKVL
ncbi:MAG: phosphomannomutase/phosphoglucomutase [Alphaproteobacteria bacterium]